MSTRYAVDKQGKYLGGFGEGASLPPESIEVVAPPDNADQPWLFPGWGPSPSAIRWIEDEWRRAELIVVAAQSDAIEEAEAGVPPGDLLPGPRKEWLRYRGLVRNWVEGREGYPDIKQRPKRPT